MKSKFGSFIMKEDYEEYIKKKWLFMFTTTGTLAAGTVAVWISNQILNIGFSDTFDFIMASFLVTLLFLSCLVLFLYGTVGLVNAYEKMVN